MGYFNIRPTELTQWDFIHKQSVILIYISKKPLNMTNVLKTFQTIYSLYTYLHDGLPLLKHNVF